MSRRRSMTERRLSAVRNLSFDYRRLAVRVVLATLELLAEAHDGGVSRRRVVNFLRGSSPLRDSEAGLAAGSYALFDHLRASWIEELLENLLDEGHIGFVEGGAAGRLALTPAGARVVRGREAAPEKAVPRRPHLGENAALEEALRELRRDLARREERAAYTVFPNESLAALAAARPTSLAELALVPGFGEARIRRFGRRVIATIRKKGG